MIWIVTSPERIHGEAAYLNALADAGPVTLLLRKPGCDLHAYTSLLEQLHDHSKVMITAYPELLLRYPVMGLHVSEGMREAMIGKHVGEVTREAMMGKHAGEGMREAMMGKHVGEVTREAMMGKHAGGGMREAMMGKHADEGMRETVIGKHADEVTREAMMEFLMREETQKTVQQSATGSHSQKDMRGPEGARADDLPAQSGRNPEGQPTAPHPKPVLSTSIHTPHSPGEQWRYLLLGPVFDSISKTGYSGKGHLFHTVPPNSIAIGGVQASNIAKVKTMGFRGAALLGAIWQNPTEAVKNYQLIQQLWEHS